MSIEVSPESDWYACLRYSNPYCCGVLLESNFSSICQYVCQHLPCESNYYLQTMGYSVHVCVLHVIYTRTDRLLMTLTFDDLCPGKHNSALCQAIFPYIFGTITTSPHNDFPKVQLSDVYTLIKGNHVSLVTRKPVSHDVAHVI